MKNKLKYIAGTYPNGVDNQLYNKMSSSAENFLDSFLKDIKPPTKDNTFVVITSSKKAVEEFDKAVKALENSNK